MEENESLYLVLSKIAKIATSRVSMFSISDRYSHPPFLRFRFELLDKNDVSYIFLRNTITNFRGKLNWVLQTKYDSENFLIIPLTFTDTLENNFYDKNFYIKKYSLLSYQKLIDDAIDDIPLLAQYISLEYAKKNKI